MHRQAIVGMFNQSILGSAKHSAKYVVLYATVFYFLINKTKYTKYTWNYLLNNMHTNHMLHVHHMFAGKFMHVVNIFIFTTRLYIFKQVKNWNFFL